jgi:hypothetical protein
MVSGGGGDITIQLEVEDMINSSAVMEKVLNSSNAAEGDTVSPICENINRR